MSAPAKYSYFLNLRVYLMRVVSQPRYGHRIDMFVASINEKTGVMGPSTRCGLLCAVHVRGPTQQPQSCSIRYPDRSGLMWIGNVGS